TSACWRCRRLGQLVARIGAIGVMTVTTYVVLSPYTVRFEDQLRHELAVQLGAAFSSGMAAKSSWFTLVPVTIGWLPCALALVGLAVVVRREAGAATVMAVFPVTYAVILVRAGGLLYARYFAPLAPFVALFAGVGVQAIASRVWPRRATALCILLVLVVV